MPAVTFLKARVAFFIRPSVFVGDSGGLKYSAFQPSFCSSMARNRSTHAVTLHGLLDLCPSRLHACRLVRCAHVFPWPSDTGRLCWQSRVWCLVSCVFDPLGSLGSIHALFLRTALDLLRQKVRERGLVAVVEANAGGLQGLPVGSSSLEEVSPSASRQLLAWRQYEEHAEVRLRRPPDRLD